MFDLFSVRARKAIALAMREALALRHDRIDSGHLLLGLMATDGGIAVTTLGRHATIGKLREQLTILTQPGTASAPTGPLPFTPATKSALEAAAAEARTINHTYIGTEHLVLALLAQADGEAARILVAAGVDLAAVRREIVADLARSDETAAPPAMLERAEAERQTALKVATTEARNLGIAIGISQGHLDELLRLTAAGRLTVAVAREEIEGLMIKGVVKAALAQEALGELRGPAQ